MNADDLRAVAAEIRHKANDATPSPWEIGEVFGPYPEEPAIPIHADVEPLIGGGLSLPDAHHVAAWHPAVALAVADWLEAEADIWDEVLTIKAELSPKGWGVDFGLSTHTQALALVKAWRGES